MLLPAYLTHIFSLYIINKKLLVDASIVQKGEKMSKSINNWIQSEEDHHKIKNNLNQILAKHELNLNEFYVLYYLCDAPNHALAINEFCDKIDLSFSALSRLISHMSTKSCGVIERIANDNDKRSTLIHLTSHGENVLESAVADVNNYLNNNNY